jgi:Divergent InlB B-repeat domain
MNGNVSVSARFARPGILPVAVVGHGTVDSCSRHCSEPMIEGNEMTLRATPRKGAQFVRWEGACRGTRRECTFIATPGVAVRAVFAQQ